MKWDKVFSSGFAVLGTIATQLWGGLDDALSLLITFMVLDYIMGVICGYKEQKLSSEIGFRGILKKVTILIVIAVVVKIDSVTSMDGLIRNMIIYFYVGLDGISILENAGRMGIPIPEKLKDALVQLKEGNKKEVKE